MANFPLQSNLFSDDVKLEPIRAGFGRGLKLAGERDDRVVPLCADLTESTQMHIFRDAFPKRFVQIGIAEQNLVTVASGMARMGKIPFVSSYAAFSPGRNWEQIKTTAALNDQPVKIIGSHAGVSVGPDGATHQMLEDIALMRVMPNMIVIAPGDSIEAEKATLAIAGNGKPSYMRLAREKTPVFSTEDSPFEIGKAYVLREGSDVTIVTTGTMILASSRKTGRVVTAEEAQKAGGLGGAVAELLSEKLPTPLMRIGINDRYGESGAPMELMEHFGLDGDSVARTVSDFIQNTSQYHREY
ncbi:transketolase [Candidatus Saccharibacteria bacterium 32-49-10]|nr:MAG: transketolase [Candidatus Saccharibacteria bacterium 32-49-10]